MSDNHKNNIIQPIKSLGQHFLFDPSILKRIALSTGSLDSQTVIEVGPGPGGLTKQLLEAGADPVIAIEADERFATGLMKNPELSSRKLKVLHRDARKMNWEAMMSEYSPNKPAKIIANLPYNVGTILLLNWLKSSSWRAEMALLLQKEVALRICAPPNDKSYGRLSVIAQAVTKPTIAFTLPPGAFRPPPKVDSALVVFKPLPDSQQFKDISTLETVTAAAFSQRRKMLKTSLAKLSAQYGKSIGEWLDSAKIKDDLRPEVLTQTEFQRLATCLKA